MTDLISRQAAIEYLMANMNWFDEEGYEADEDYKRECITELINEVPSAEPVWHGKWIKADSQQYFRKHYPCFTCSECGYRKDSQKTWNYCPNCGAYMRGEK